VQIFRWNADLKTKSILGIIGVIAFVVVITYFSEWVLLLPSLIGLLILFKFGKDDVAKYIGLLILKPASSFLLIFIASKLHVFEQLPYHSPEILLAFLWIVPELPLTLIIFRVYRHLFISGRVALIFLLGDVVRWSSLFVVGLLPDPFPEPYFYTQLYIFAFFAIFYPSLYAIGGFITVIKRANSNKIKQMAN